MSEACDFCKETSCILGGEITLDGKDYFVDLRFDLDEPDHPNFDMQLVDKAANTGDWTNCVEVNYCFNCGRKLC
jgi:hypothetical protein